MNTWVSGCLWALAYVIAFPFFIASRIRERLSRKGS